MAEAHYWLSHQSMIQSPVLTFADLKKCILVDEVYPVPLPVSRPFTTSDGKADEMSLVLKLPHLSKTIVKSIEEILTEL